MSKYFGDPLPTPEDYHELLKSEKSEENVSLPVKQEVMSIRYVNKIKKWAQEESDRPMALGDE